MYLNNFVSVPNFTSPCCLKKSLVYIKSYYVKDVLIFYIGSPLYLLVSDAANYIRCNQQQQTQNHNGMSITGNRSLPYPLYIQFCFSRIEKKKK